MPAPKDLDPGRSPLHFFGNELRHYRLRAELTQEQLGRRVNYNGDSISKIETGDQAPNLYLAQRCDEILGSDGALAKTHVQGRSQTGPRMCRRSRKSGKRSGGRC